MNAILVALTLLCAAPERTNPFTPAPLVGRVDPAPAIPATTWVVVLTDGEKVTVVAEKLATFGELIILLGEEDEMVFACHKSKLAYCHKVRR